jgi:ATP-binding cassette, subfamily B, bacterial
MAPANVRGVDLQDVSYRYPQSAKGALSEISYTFPTGTTAIVGPNGAGKSTLVKLLTGLLEPTRGAISVQLTDGTCLPTEQVEKSVLFQEPSHLYLTIRQNVTMQFERTPGEDGRIHEALELAGLNRAVDELPDGIDTLVGAGFGGQLDLSGGQWQRLALARAFVREGRDLMILDEPSSGLDPEAEHQVHAQMRAYRRGRTSLLISHRLSAVRDADLIAVLDEGRIIEQGTHDTLLEAGGRYARLFRLQAAGYQEAAG